MQIAAIAAFVLAVSVLCGCETTYTQEDMDEAIAQAVAEVRNEVIPYLEEIGAQLEAIQSQLDEIESTASNLQSWGSYEAQDEGWNIESAASDIRSAVDTIESAASDIRSAVDTIEGAISEIRLVVD